MDTKTKTYTPRLGSKVSLATQALLDGPMTSVQLAAAIDTEVKNLNALLWIPIEHGYIVKVKDETGLLHFALGGMAIDERFSAYQVDDSNARRHGRALADVPVVKTVASASVTTSPDALAFANPFGRRAAPSFAPAKKPAIGTVTAKPVRERQLAQISKPHLLDATAKEKRQMRAPSPAPAPGFAAGLFSNGELVISVGTESLKLNPHHTRQLFDYLDKVTGMAHQSEGSLH